MKHKKKGKKERKSGQNGKKEERTMHDVFFFSSRRRHTRYWRDWSSDVCSSDLASQPEIARQLKSQLKAWTGELSPPGIWALKSEGKIGRASCRERV